MALFDINDQPNIPITPKVLEANGWKITAQHNERGLELFHTAIKRIPCKSTTNILSTFIITIYYDAPSRTSLLENKKYGYACEEYRYDQYWTQEQRNCGEIPVETHYESMRKTKIKSLQHLNRTIDKLLKKHNLIRI